MSRKKPQATNQWGSKGLVRRDTSAETKKLKKRNAGMALTPEYDCMEYNRFVQYQNEKAARKLHGVNLFGKSVDPTANMDGLRREFIYPPFSVLNSRDGHWQARKRAWNRLEVKAIGDETLDERSGGDPVLAELMMRWFCPPGGVVVDPFAGSASWGIVASVCGFQYFGVDINPGQVAANRVRARKLLNTNMPLWTCGDSRNIDTEMTIPPCDMLLSCPPYGDLEVYSDDPRDLSTLLWTEFRTKYREIIGRCAKLLKDDRFAVWVVGEIRDSDERHKPYRNFVSDTIKFFQGAGMDYYNQMVLVTAVGSLPVRARRAFKVSRKIGPTHQLCLVFSKGDPRKAAEVCNNENSTR